ncbi:hypothetical protein [Aliikangiella coralliicola]|uniref:Uncharacterized protein n=1 Tax=Aliikangiella coralliicola TaxID=2592383 RepID=A0A545U4P8_9GAMM|nr:hypothetical protein [Aliikangiella coralliicola]TQV84436.1 hypothetical protein FLL46_22735 [Aliikangiella coralliicola]
MKNTIFPSADHYQIPRALYVGAWKVWFKRFSDHEAWREGVMPAVSENAKLHQLIEANKRFSLEVINRLMVPWYYRDKSQICESFFLMNQDMLKRVKSDDNPELELVRLSDQALDYWDGLTFLEQDLFTAYAEARIQADIETPSHAPVVIDDHGLEVIGEDIYPPVVPDKSASDKEFASAIVAWIEEDPFTPMYQRLPVGEAVSSWHDRLEAFFWPKPRNGLMQVSHSADALMYRAEILAKGIETSTAKDGSEWNKEDRDMAVKTANEIFLQAGVPQKDVTWENVYQVMKSAISADENSSAKMNSGWSLLASFATHWLNNKPDRIPMACWNSRVSASILSRLDFLMVEAGYEDHENRFEHIGRVPGVGGTRPRELSLNWPDGYRSWKNQVAASRFINLIVECLNNEKNSDGSLKYEPMPIPTGGRAPWSIQGVQLVLFSDGY